MVLNFVDNRNDVAYKIGKTYSGGGRGRRETVKEGGAKEV
jgi:hypothetical protein